MTRANVYGRIRGISIVLGSENELDTEGLVGLGGSQRWSKALV